MSIDAGIIILIVLFTAGALFAARAGIRSIQSARKVSFFRTRNAYMLSGWRWLALAFVLFSSTVASALFGERVVNQLFPPPPGPTVTATWTPIPTRTLIPSPTNTFTPTTTLTPDGTLTPTLTQTPSQTPTQTATVTSTFTPSRTNTAIPTITPFPTQTRTPTPSRTPIPTSTPLPTRTPRPTWTPSPTRTPRPTLTFTSTSTNTLTPTASLTPTFTSTPTVTRTLTPTRTPIPTSTMRPTDTPRPTSTRQPTHTSTLTATITRTPTNTSTATVTPSQTLTFIPTLTFTPSLTSTPTSTRTPRPTQTLEPTRTPRPTLTLTFPPTNSLTPTVSLTPTFTLAPTITRTPTPTRTPNPTSTVRPTSTPRPTSTRQPTNTETSTATITRTPTNTSTVTVTPSQTFTPTLTLTPSTTLTFTPTRTPRPTQTPEPSRTPRPTLTFKSTPTATATPSQTRTPTRTPTPNRGCDRIELVSNLTVPDSSVFAPGSSFTKIWRLRNSGTCTWRRTYRVVLASGDLMRAQKFMPLPAEIAPGQTIDLAMNFTAPLMEGSYRGNWQLRNSRGDLFGITSTANRPFSVAITVREPALTGTRYNFVDNACSARWFSSAGNLKCPSVDNDKNGFILRQSSAMLEDGKLVTRPSVLTAPQNISNGYIRGVYPSYKVQNGDRFQAIISCEDQATSCNVLFRLDYLADGLVREFWDFGEHSDGSYYTVDLDLSPLAGQDVRFVLTVLSLGPASGDRALWVEPRIVRGGTPLITPTP